MRLVPILASVVALYNFRRGSDHPAIYMKEVG
jgi:hypothetical protein